jgi:hypothetical protein
VSQNIGPLQGAYYSNVPAVTLPKQGGGSATFYDVSDTTATAADVSNTKYFYTSAGVRTQGTNSGGGSSKNVQIVQQSNTRITSTSYSKACGDITVSKTGTYNVYWTAYRTSSSGTWGTQLYIAGSAYGSAQTTFSSYYQAIHLSNVSLTANQSVAVYGRSRGSNYYLYVGQLTIIEA